MIPFDHIDQSRNSFIRKIGGDNGINPSSIKWKRPGYMSDHLGIGAAIYEDALVVRCADKYRLAALEVEYEHF